ncbi:hypothetical protein [Archangium sp.]|uniref:hypothetical protein n=1 Tax=Archangium sp. TaxID=1872627 RepID=UPI00286D0F1A|nr:hypothetical protein [Archangium sp.]
MTDPYLRTSFDESGDNGDGFEWFGRFLRDGLGLAREQSFDLFLHPGMGDAFDLLRSRIAAIFSKASIKPFAVQGGASTIGSTWFAGRMESSAASSVLR